MASTNIQVGSHLFCTAAPELVPDTLLTPGNYGQRLIQSVVLRIEKIEGAENIKQFYEGIGVQLPPDFDFNKPRSVEKPDAHAASHALEEMILEVARLREFPDRPSRLDCLYLWEEEARARDFYSRRPHTTGLYEVEVVECRRVCVADFNVVSWHHEVETVESLMDRARRYWAADKVPVPEVLLEGTVRILKSLSSG